MSLQLIKEGKCEAGCGGKAFMSVRFAHVTLGIRLHVISQSLKGARREFR
jgi:hypothetical protein